MSALRRTAAALAATTLLTIAPAAAAHATEHPASWPCRTTVHVWANSVNGHVLSGDLNGNVHILSNPVTARFDAGNYCADSQIIAEEVTYGSYNNNRWALIQIPGQDSGAWISGVFISGGPNGDSDILDVNGIPLDPFVI